MRERERATRWVIGLTRRAVCGGLVLRTAGWGSGRLGGGEGGASGATCGGGAGELVGPGTGAGMGGARGRSWGILEARRVGQPVGGGVAHIGAHWGRGPCGARV